jgi:hypothetical protein
MRRCNLVASSLAFGDKTSEVLQCCFKSPLHFSILRYRRSPQVQKLDRIHGIPLFPPRGGDLPTSNTTLLVPCSSSSSDCPPAYTTTKSYLGIRHKTLSRRIESSLYATLHTAAA